MRVFFFALAAALLLSGCADKSAGPKPATVKSVDLQRYLGTWYEIARYPHSFERDCTGVKARYSQNGDGTIEVTNTCYKHSLDGKKDVAKGEAYAVEGSNNSKLKVTFFWPFYGDYWIFDLAPDYSYALVGSPDRRYLWILSRSKKLAQKDKNHLLQKMDALGFGRQKLIWTKQ